MSYTVSYAASATKDEALILHWNDYSKDYLVSHSAPVWDAVLGTYATPSATSESVTHLGVSNSIRSLDTLSTTYPGVQVINGILTYGGSTYSNGVLINSISGGTRLTTTKEVQGFSIVILLPGLYAVNQTTGYIAASVSLSVYYRAHDPLNPPTVNDPWTVLYTDYTIAAKQRAEVVKTIRHSDVDTPLPLSKYEILLIRNTPSHTGEMNICDDMFIKELNEIVYDNVAYNNTALLGLVIRATDQLSGQLPAVTALVKGTKIKVPTNLVSAYQVKYDQAGKFNREAIEAAYLTPWDGQLSEEKVWSDNPVWCLYDLLTNERYGLSDYYKISDRKRGLMLANFYLMAKYCDETIAYLDEESADDATSYRPRFSLNIVLDQAKAASEWVGQIVAIMRGSYFYSEGIFWLDIDRKKPVTQVFNMSNITEFSQSSTSRKGISNVFEVQWINPASGYLVETFRLEDPELQQNPLMEERKQALQLVGVTNIEQAKSLAKYALLSSKMNTKLVTFKTGTDGLRCMVSDVIGIQHDVPLWGFGGVVDAYNTTTREVTLSTNITLTAGYTYYIAIVANDEAKTYKLDVTDFVPTNKVILHETPVTLPVQGAKFVIGKTPDMLAKFKVVKIQRDTNEICTITAMTYNDALYDMCDLTGDLGVFSLDSYYLLTNPQRDSVQGVFAEQKFYQDSLGVWKVGVDVYYDIPASQFWKAASLYYAKVGTTEYEFLETNTTGHFFIPFIPTGDYQFVVTSTYSSGKQTILDALSDTSRHPWYVLSVNNYAPNSAFSRGVRGLLIQNNYTGNTFDGKDCIVLWSRPTVIDTSVSTTAGDEVAGAGTSADDNWFSYYEVEVSDDRGLRRVDRVYSERYVYSHEMNHEDGITRTFKVTVYAFDILGRKSEGASIWCYNPAPPALM